MASFDPQNSPMSEALLFPHLQSRKVKPEKVNDLSMVTQPERGSTLSEVPLVPSPSSQPSALGAYCWGMRHVEALIL